MVDAAARVCLVCCTCLIGSEIRGGGPSDSCSLIGSEIRGGRGGNELVFRPFVAVDKFILIVDYQQLALAFESH